MDGWMDGCGRALIKVNSFFSRLQGTVKKNMYSDSVYSRSWDNETIYKVYIAFFLLHVDVF